MPVAVKIATGFASFVANLLILAGMIISADRLAAPAVIIAGFLLGFSAGCVLGSAFKNASPLAVGTGAFAAALTMYTPVILATYGIALIGVPVLLLYAACVAAGAYMVRRASVTPQHSS